MIKQSDWLKFLIDKWYLSEGDNKSLRLYIERLLKEQEDDLLE